MKKFAFLARKVNLQH